MIAISKSDFYKNGCVDCGCESASFIYLDDDFSKLTCAECRSEFIILNDGIVESEICHKTNKIDSKGSPIFEHYKLQEHPRKNILKHLLVLPDIRPENGIGDFCFPRGISFTLSCAVKSKEAGIRITDMINRVNTEYNNKQFSCTLEYNDKCPLRVNVRIDYPTKLKGIILLRLIDANDQILTEDILRKTINMEMNFEYYWKYFVSSGIFNVVNFSFIDLLVDDPTNITQDQLDYGYLDSDPNYNYLDQFELFAIYHQIDAELSNDNLDNAIILANHLIRICNSPFNCDVILKTDIKNDFTLKLRQSFINSVISLLHGHYDILTGESVTLDLDEFNNCMPTIEYPIITDNNKNAFLLEWHLLVSKIFSVIDIDKLKISSAFEKEKISTISFNKISNDNLETYIMFSLFGLYIHVSKKIEENNYDNAILAISHVANQQKYELIETILSNSDNSEKYKEIYKNLLDISNNYFYCKKNNSIKLK